LVFYCISFVSLAFDENSEGGGQKKSKSLKHEIEVWLNTWLNTNIIILFLL